MRPDVQDIAVESRCIRADLRVWCVSGLRTRQEHGLDSLGATKLSTRDRARSEAVGQDQGISSLRDLATVAA